MPLDKVARAFVPRVDQVKEPPDDIPHTQVMCQCPAPCWAAIKTIEGLKRTGMAFQFHCTKCCPDEFRESLQAVADMAKADPRVKAGEPLVGIFGKDMAAVLEGFGPEDIKDLFELAQEEYPGERQPVSITMTLDVGEWVDILTTLEQTSIWLKRKKPDDPQHPRGEKHMSDLYAKVKRYVVYEVGRQVIKKEKPGGR